MALEWLFGNRDEELASRIVQQFAADIAAAQEPLKLGIANALARIDELEKQVNVLRFAAERAPKQPETIQTRSWREFQKLTDQGELLDADR